MKLLNLYFLNSEVLTKENKDLILKNLITLTLIIASINIIYIYTTTQIIVKTKTHNITHTVIEISNFNEEVDLTFIANLVGSDSMIVKYKDHTSDFCKKDDILISCDKKLEYKPLINILYDKWFISDDFKLIIIYDVNEMLSNYIENNKIDKVSVRIELPELIINDILFILILSIIFLLSSSIMIILITSQVRISDLISKAGNEAMLSSKNNQKFTEAMHHEVKTPLAVLNSAFDKMEMTIEDLWSNIDNYEYMKSRLLLEKDLIRNILTMVNLNFEIIYNILDKQKSNRAIRYSNGNYNLYDLIQHSFEGLKWDTKIKYKYDIDNRFKLISNSEAGLTNEDFTNIVTNHVRNSLEANSNNIKVVLKDISNNKVSIYIADNGKGMNSEVKSMIYLPNFSTKKELKDSDNQGIGMYLCQTLLTEVGGYEKVEQTGSNGTIFRLVLPISEYKGK